MNVKIKAIHFEIAERLVNFVNKKAERVAHRVPEMTDFEVQFTLVKPEAAKNKEATVRMTVPPFGDMVANKTADSFEEAFDGAVEALERQLEKKQGRK